MQSPLDKTELVLLNMMTISCSYSNDVNYGFPLIALFTHLVHKTMDFIRTQKNKSKNLEQKK